MPEEKIEVGYRNIGEALGVDYHHKFILYTDKTGAQHTISGWTGPEKPGLPFGIMDVQTNLPYDRNNPDHPDNPNTKYSDGTNQKQYRELITEGVDLTDTWNKMVENAAKKDNRYPYDPLDQNSNTLADSVLRDVGLPQPKKDGFFWHLAPGSEKPLDEFLVPKNPNERGISEALDKALSMEDTKPPINKETEALYAALHTGLADQMTKAGAEKFIDPMVSATALACMEKGLTAGKIDRMGINTQTNTIFASDQWGTKMATVDAFAAAKVDPQETLQQASQLQDNLNQQQQERSMQMAQQHKERAGPSFA